MHKLTILAALGVLGAYGADERLLTLTMRAQADFERVEAAPFPGIQETARCAQSQAEVLPLLKPAEAPVVRLRKGYCALLGATITESRADYQAAAGDFARAMAGWEARAPEPLPSGLQVLSGIARLKAGAPAETLPDIEAGLADAVSRSACPARVISEWQCAQLIDAGRLWLGWLASRRGDLAEAAARFRPFPTVGWNGWVAGRQALADGRYAEAVTGFEQAVRAWKDDERYPKPGLSRILGPKPDLADAVYQLGAAQYLAGQYQAAAGTLDAALKGRPDNAHAMFVRGLARAAMGQAEAALADYQLASRMAFAHPEVAHAAALARYYRGVWQFRRGDFARAEDEFASALNQDPGADLRADATGWRYMAAVAGGSCEASGRRLETALKEASGFFPRREAERLLEGCRAAPAQVTRKQP